MDPSNRQERLQMRQRGAGTRQVNNVDFGISFDPIPRRSARNTPQQASQKRASTTPSTARGAQRRSSKTPSRKPLTQRGQVTAARSGSRGSVKVAARAQSDTSHGSDDGTETRSAKRRKLASSKDGAQSTAASSSRQPTLNQAEKSSAVQLAAGPDGQEPETQISPRADKENLAPGTHAKKTPRAAGSRETPRTGPSTNTARPSHASRSSIRQPDDVSIVSARAGDVDTEDEVLVAILDESQEETMDGDHDGLSLMTAPADLPDSTMELVAVMDDTTYGGDDTIQPSLIDPSLLNQSHLMTPAPRSANIKKKRASLQTPVQVSSDHGRSSELALPFSDISAQSEHHKSDLTPSAKPATSANSVPSDSRAHPAFDDSFYQPNNDEEDETYLQPTSPVNPTPKPAPKKPRKRAAPKGIRKSKSATPRSRQRNGRPNTFPVLTRRFINISALPTITEEGVETGVEDADSDSTIPDPEPGSTTTTTTTIPTPTQLFQKFHTRTSPNAIDILAQFCHEDTEAYLDTLNHHPNHPTTITTTAIQTFNTTLSAHLSTLSTSLDHLTALQSRTRQSRRDKTALQTRWTALRHERERIAIATDVARRDRDGLRLVREGDAELSELLFRVELEGDEDGVDDGEDGGDLEWGLERAAGALSSSVGGGLLERVREFNGLLEGMVEVLDRRRGGLRGEK